MREIPRQPGGVLLAWTTLRQTISLTFEFISAFLVAGLLWWLAVPTLVLIGPATAMLYHLAQAAVDGQIVAIRDFRAALRGSWPWSTIHSLAWLAAWLLIFVNARFYARLVDPPLVFSLAVPVLLIWAGIGFFLFPAALRQQQTPRLRTTLRRALALLVRKPGVTLGVWVLGSGLVIIATMLPILLVLLPGALAVWSQALAVALDPAVENNHAT